MHFDARVVGPGRAGTAVSTALRAVGWVVDGPLGRDVDLGDAAADTSAVILAVPDRSIAAVAQSVRPGEGVLCHLSGSLGLDALAPHDRRASVHPLVAITKGAAAAGSLRGAWFAASGDPFAERMIDALEGRSVSVDDADRAAYHAAAVVASNHVVALLGQVERIAASIDVPLEAFLDLARCAIESVSVLGPADALTGPVARGDWSTVRTHLDALDPSERPGYSIMADLARQLTEVLETPTADVA